MIFDHSQIILLQFFFFFLNVNGKDRNVILYDIVVKVRQSLIINVKVR